MLDIIFKTISSFVSFLFSREWSTLQMILAESSLEDVQGKYIALNLTNQVK